MGQNRDEKQRHKLGDRRDTTVVEMNPEPRGRGQVPNPAEKSAPQDAEGGDNINIELDDSACLKPMVAPKRNADMRQFFQIRKKAGVALSSQITKATIEQGVKGLTDMGHAGGDKRSAFMGEGDFRAPVLGDIPGNVDGDDGAGEFEPDDDIEGAAAEAG